MTVSYSTELLLTAQEHAVLSRLAKLMNGPALNYDKAQIHRGVAGSSPPPGADLIAGHGGDSPDVSLYAYHRKRLEERCKSSVSVRLTAIAQAEHDYETAIKRPPHYLSGDSDENRDQRDEAILRWEGKPAEWVAVMEGCSFSHVRKLRALHKRRPSDGLQVEKAA